MAEWKPEDPEAWKGKQSGTDNPEADNPQAGYDSAADIVTEIILECGIKRAVIKIAHSVKFMIDNESNVKKTMGSGYSPYVIGRMKYFVEFVERHKDCVKKGFKK